MAHSFVPKNLGWSRRFMGKCSWRHYQLLTITINFVYEKKFYEKIFANRKNKKTNSDFLILCDSAKFRFFAFAILCDSVCIHFLPVYFAPVALSPAWWCDCIM